MEQISLFEPQKVSQVPLSERIFHLAPGDSIRIGKYKLTYNVFYLYEAESNEEHFCLGKDVESVLLWIDSF
ncbi:hypothetical protein [Alkalicoccus luteus]|uniref:Uncharacterized protein n=1 Tax=Alkalicoccus luteus TaxID=1237094 RepID=A0A969TW14_9BACI|nr:hypothetical protein [Alkalicoccus luteus]NJP38965.1 hypothetical protein [Alkalicoccus luteus]